MTLRNCTLGVFTGFTVALAWWLSHFPALNMATAILPSMATTTCLWLSAPYLKTWRVIFSHVLAATIAASTWFFLPDLVISLSLTVAIVAILTTAGLRHAPAVATAAACAMHPDNILQLGIAIAIQLTVITACIYLWRRFDNKSA